MTVLINFVLLHTVQSRRSWKRRSHRTFLFSYFDDLVQYCGLSNQSLKYRLKDEITQQQNYIS